MISKKVLISIALTATAAWASPFLYSFSAPAITTGVQQSDAFSLTFTAPQILSSDTNLITLGTLSVPNSFNSQYPTLVNAILFTENPGSLVISFNGPPGSGTLIGSLLGSVPFDHVGTYQVNWQIIGKTGGDSVGGTLVIADQGVTAPAPEPATLGIVAAGLLALRRFRRARLLD